MRRRRAHRTQWGRRVAGRNCKSRAPQSEGRCRTIYQQTLVGTPEAYMTVNWANDLEVLIKLNIFFVYLILKRGPNWGLHELRHIIKHTLFLSTWRVIALW